MIVAMAFVSLDLDFETHRDPLLAGAHWQGDKL